MDELKFRMPSFFDPGYDVITIKKRDLRKHAHHAIIIETLRGMTGQMPTRDQLQKFVRIRRKRFIQILKYLLETQDVERTGTGSKNCPFRYRLGPKNLR